jgi:hypothetical protein
MLRPLTIIRSLLRPVSTISPPSRKPMSPVSSQPSGGQHARSFLRLPEVAPHQAGAAGEDPAYAALGHDLAVVSANFQLVAGEGRAAAGEVAGSGGAGRRRRDVLALQAADIQVLDAQPLAERRHGQSQGRFGHAVARHIGLVGEARGREPLGEIRQGAGADHVATEARDPPAREVQALDAGSLGAPGAEFETEGRAVGDGRAVAADQVQPEQRPAHEGAVGRRSTDIWQHSGLSTKPTRPMSWNSGSQEIAGRPASPAAVADDRLGVGHQGAVRHQHAGREARAARGELQIAGVVLADRPAGRRPPVPAGRRRCR